MKLHFVAHLLLAVSGTAKKQIIQQYQSKPNFPKTPEEQEELFARFDAVMPQGTKDADAKRYAQFLARILFNVNPPGAIYPEDFEDGGVGDTLEAYALAVKERRLAGDASNLDSYDTIADLLAASTKGKERKDKTGFTLDNLPEDAAPLPGATGLASRFPAGHPRRDVEEGSEIIAQVGAWKAYRINMRDPKGKAAGSWLGMNHWWDASWCVGRDRMWNTVSYMDQGNFYFFCRNGRPKYPVSTTQSVATMWDLGDNIAWTTNQSTSGSWPNMEAAAKAEGITLSFGEVSTLPPEVVPILAATVKVDPYLAKLVPASQLVETPATDLDKVLTVTSGENIIKDLNQNASSGRASGTLMAILGRCVERTNPKFHRKFDGLWDQFSESLMIKYIEALSNAGWTSLPASLEEYFVKEAENFEF